MRLLKALQHGKLKLSQNLPVIRIRGQVLLLLRVFLHVIETMSHTWRSPSRGIAHLKIVLSAGEDVLPLFATNHHLVVGQKFAENKFTMSMGLSIQQWARGRTVRAQAGVRWGEFNRETQLHGLATTGGVVSTTGSAGLTLGGGIGWLMGKHGLAADNLIAAEVVTAAGEVVRASAEEDRDLFWGLRGGAGNFGVVSSLEYRLHPVGPVMSGLVAHPVERAHEVLQFFRDVTASVPDELTLDGGLLHAPDGSGVPLAVIVACHCGSLAEGEAGTGPIKGFSSPVVDTIAPANYVGTNTTIFDPGFPRGARNYWKSHFLAELSDAAIDALIAQFAVCPSPMTMGPPHETASARRRSLSGARATTCWASPSGSTRKTMKRTSRGRAPPTTRCARTWPASRTRTTRQTTRPKMRSSTRTGPTTRD